MDKLALWFAVLLMACCAQAQTNGRYIPQLRAAPTIDGDLSEWQALAWHDGVWDLHRAASRPWFTSRNTLQDETPSVSVTADLQARYYLAWDSTWLYFGAEVWDNVRDVDDPKDLPRRWYYRDAVAVFLEAPHDPIPEQFGAGDHGFAFVADTTYPTYGAWWRHGKQDSSYLEQPMPADAATYRLRNAPELGGAGYVLEARIKLAALLPLGDPQAHAPRMGDRYGLMLVHCDPDGGGYGGHLLIYGSDDLDSTWESFVLTGPKSALRK